MPMASYETVPIDGFTQTTVEGVLDLDGSAAMLRQIATDADSQDKHLLIDLRDATSTGLSYADVYRLVGLLAEEPGTFSGTNRASGHGSAMASRRSSFSKPPPLRRATPCAPSSTRPPRSSGSRRAPAS